MTTHREVIVALASAADAGDAVVLATVVRVTGSSYGGVGARMVIRGDSSTIGLVSGGCLESDLTEHALRVQETGRAEIVRYDTRDDDDAPWGLGLGCNGLIEVLLEPLAPRQAKEIASLLDDALSGDTPSVVATVIRTDAAQCDLPSIGAHALVRHDAIRPLAGWGAGPTLDLAARHLEEALAAGRRGFAAQIGPVEVAFEVVTPAVRLVVCGTGPDVAPVARMGAQLGWDVTVVDHRALTKERAARFQGARVVECPDPVRLAEVVPLDGRTAAVVMSHSFPRDRGYVRSLLASDVGYIGALGPRARTERMLAELSSADTPPLATGDRFFAPVGLDIGGEGPDAIALSIIAQVSAVVSDRGAGHLRNGRAPLHTSSSRVAAVVLAAGGSSRLGFPKQLVLHEGEPLVRRIARAAVEVGADPVVVVLGADAENIAREFFDLPSVMTTVNSEWKAGLASSLAAGLKVVLADRSCDGVLVTLADQPLVDALALQRLMRAFGGGQRIVASAYDDTIGVPAVFGREHLKELMQLTGDAGAGSWLRDRRDQVTAIPLQAAVADIDSPSDLSLLTPAPK